MAIIISTAIDPRTDSDRISSQPEEDAEPSPPPVPPGITAAFAAAYARYERALGQTLDLVNLENPQSGRSSMPEIDVTFGADEPPATITFDVDLLATLIETYALRGWNGIRQIEQLLSTRWTDRDADAAPGGTRLSEWAAVVPFFRAARNLLAKLVRDTIADIERQAHARIESRLRVADTAFERVWTSELRMRIVQRTTYRQAGKERIPETVSEFAFGNQPLSDDVFVDLTAAVKTRAAVERRLEETRRDTERLAARRDQYERNAPNRDAPGYRSPYDEEATPENVDAKRRQQAAVEAELRDLLSTVEASLLQNCPVAMLVFPGLRPGFTQAEMEHAIGAALDSVRMRVRKLIARMAKAPNQTELRLPDDPARPLGDYGKASSTGIESTLLDPVFLIEDDAAVLPLLSEETWHDMVATDAIPRGGFSYFVYFHYLNDLLERRERAEQKTQRSDVGQALNTSLALVSLVTLFVPVLLPLELALTAFSIAHGIDAAATQLRAIDTRLDALLVQPAASAMSVFGRIGELEAMRRELVETAVRNVLLGLVLNLAGSQWIHTRRLLMGVGYFTDLATLYGGLRGDSEA
jgi:hypothetical protein